MGKLATIISRAVLARRRVALSVVAIAAAASMFVVHRAATRDPRAAEGSFSPAVINGGRVEGLQAGDTLSLPVGSPFVSQGDITLAGSNSLFQYLSLINAPNGIWISNLNVAQTTPVKTLDVVPNGTVATGSAALLALAVGGDNRTSKASGSGILTNYGVYGNALNGDENYSGFFDNGEFVVNGEAIMNSITLQGNESQHYAINSTNVDPARAAGFTSISVVLAGSNDTTAGGEQNIAVSGAAEATRSAGTNPLNNIGVYGNATGGQNNYSCYCDSGGLTQIQGDQVNAQLIFALGSPTAIQLGGSLNANSETIVGAESVGLASGITITSGAGAPSAGACGTTAPIGSLYTNTSGGTLTTLYVCTAASTWTPK
jgi:hypothetical protein